MLPAAARLTRSQDFGLVVRRGRRAGRSRLVLHVLQPEASHADRGTAPTRESEEPARVGFVVSKAVGNAVVRHRVARQLRHLVRQRLDCLPAGTSAVVRALPRAAPATSAELGKDLDSALRKLRLSTPADGPC